MTAPFQRRLIPAALAANAALCLAQVLCPSPASAQLVREPVAPQAAPKETPAGARRIHQELAINGDQQWADTAIDLKPGERLQLTAKGTLRYADAQKENGPEGLPRGFRDLLRVLPFNQTGRGALIGRIGDADIVEPFLVGPKAELAVRAAARLFLGINQAKNETADGSFNVVIEVFAASATSGTNSSTSAAPADAAPLATSISGVDSGFFEQIPRRIADKNGNAGDMVNFLLIGTEDQVQAVFAAAGWVKVDRTKKDAVLHGILSSISKESYVEMPMSELYLFSRPQDCGFAHAEPLSVVSTRHHLRLWKASFSLNGETVWVGAATHDIGFERDKRNNGVTHKIDPDIDVEREYVGKSLSETGLLSALARIVPANPMKEAKTATGGTFHSNGEVLIMRIAAPAPDSGH